MARQHRLMQSELKNDVLCTSVPQFIGDDLRRKVDTEGSNVSEYIRNLVLMDLYPDAWESEK
jgi:hypothetical protein